MVSSREFKVPKSLAQCADLLYTTRQQRLKLQGEVDKLQEQETTLKDHLIKELPKGEASGIAGSVARVSILTKVGARAVDWDKIHEFIFKNDAWELVQRRLNETAVKDRWDSGEDIPGVEPNQYPFVSINKL